MTLELHATPEEVMRAVEALQEFARARGVPEEIVFDLALSLEECGSNIVNHALRRDAAQTFGVTFEQSGGKFVIELRDRGPQFDPALVAARKPQADDDDLPGGWGIELVRRQVDALSYQRRGGENVLRLTKRVGAATAGCDFADRIHSNQTSSETAMALDIQILQNIGGQHAGAVTVQLSGSLDTATAPDLERKLTPVLGGHVKDIVFDLAQLKFISSAGLRVFSSTRKTLKERGGQASFINMQPQIQKVFEIMKALPGVAVFTSTAELDHYLAVQQRKVGEES
jgi:anti-sigma B factor antagonist